MFEPRSNTGPVQAHCRRVAALAAAVATRLRLAPAETALLEQAALLHHFPVELLEAGGLDRIWADLRTPGWPDLGAPQPPSRAYQVLAAFHARPAQAGDPATALLAEILDAASFFAERIEFLPFELRTIEQILDELDWMARDGFCSQVVFEALAALPHVRMPELLSGVPRLPVFPEVALKAMQIASREDVNTSDIERLVASDQVLAGRIIQAANSSLRSPVRRIGELGQAISYIGVAAARKVLTAAVFQPLFASAPLLSLWKHSLELAESAERIATRSGLSGPECFLAGLVHDIGRLALERMTREDNIARLRLMERGCEPVFAEMVLCGFEHGELGAEILRLWSFPLHLVEAVQHHHWPERHESPLAAVLYLAEVAADSGEDMPSWLRLTTAEQRLGVAVEDVGAPDAGTLRFLAV